jgi:hypothetical protein
MCEYCAEKLVKRLLQIPRGWWVVEYKRGTYVSPGVVLRSLVLFSPVLLDPFDPVPVGDELIVAAWDYYPSFFSFLFFDIASVAQLRARL